MYLQQFWHRAGLSRGVKMDEHTQNIGGSFRLVLNSELDTFSTRLYKINGERSKMATSLSFMNWMIGTTPLVDFW